MHNPNASTWAAAVSALFAGASWLVAKDARKSARRSSEIEEERRHAELEPKFNAEWWPVFETDTHKLSIELVGPVALQGLDAITIEIRDTKRKPSDLSQNISAFFMDSQVWASYRFTPGVDGAPPDGRTISYEHLSLDETIHFQLEKNPIPRGIDDQWWKESVLNSKFKIWVICEKEGYENWKIPLQPKWHP